MIPSQKITNFREEIKKDISQLWRSTAGIEDLIIENESEFRKLHQIKKKKATPIPHQNNGKSNTTLNSVPISPIKTTNYLEYTGGLSEPELSSDSESDDESFEIEGLENDSVSDKEQAPLLGPNKVSNTPLLFKHSVSEMLRKVFNSSSVMPKKDNSVLHESLTPLENSKPSPNEIWLKDLLDQSFEEES